ncbi:MAG TPA: sugar phosphorylase [Anaerolineales bacterium]|nr:sugar phosphorylase [Anaerolineales bacterium]
MDDVTAAIRDHLSFLYGEDRAAHAASRLEALLQEAKDLRPSPPTAGPITERDAMLIVYPDQLQDDGRPSLPILKRFLDSRVPGLITTVHLLPFFPSSSDDGFAVTDYLEVDPRYGTWEDVRSIGRDYRLMADAVLNHASAQGWWFQGFLRGEAPWCDYFLKPDLSADWTRVVRPRTTPLFTTVHTASGPASVWTTFSPDQVDLNYGNVELLLAVIGILLEYLRRGAQWLRLDAVGFLWKEPGSTCLHLPQTHRLLRLLHDVIEEAAPWARLVSETNVPHLDNIAYFGEGHEAHMVYQFTLPPLLAHTLVSGDSRALTAWASQLASPPHGAYFLNFLASHDGIGLVPAFDWLAPEDIERLLARAKACGGVSYRNLPTGGTGPYELNANLLDLFGGSEADAVRRLVAAHAILLSFAGVPAIYFHSLVGSRGYPEGVQHTGALRSINRQKLSVREVEADFEDRGSRRRRIFDALLQLLRLRGSLPALHPDAPQQVLEVGDHVFGLQRVSQDGQELLCLAEVASRPITVSLRPRGTSGTDILGGESLQLDSIPLEPLQARWILVDHG